MKIALFTILFLIFVAAQAEPMDYYRDFFDRNNDVTHDPDFPEYEFISAKNDMYQIAMIGDKKAISVGLSFALRENGTYSFWMLTIHQRWKNETRQMKIGKCQAFNGKWEHRDGKLFLGADMVLEAIYRDGQNLLKPVFVNATPPKGTENIDITINDGSIDTLAGLSPDSPNNGDFDCQGFFFPFWMPIPNERPW